MHFAQNWLYNNVSFSTHCIISFRLHFFLACGDRYCCDVNGFSFVKNSRKYYDDAAQILMEIMVGAVRPQLRITWSTRAPLLHLKQPSISHTTSPPSPTTKKPTAAEGGGGGGGVAAEGTPRVLVNRESEVDILDDLDSNSIGDSSAGEAAMEGLEGAGRQVRMHIQLMYMR